MVALTFVVPCYNEEAMLPETNRQLLALLDELRGKGKIAADSRIYYVDDGSRDRTWPLIAAYAAAHPQVHGIKLSRNRGHQNALLAGLLHADGEVLVSVDADLQDDLGVVEQMLDCHAQGSQIVYGVREERTTDTFMKRQTAYGYYWLLKTMGVDVVMHHADFRLMSRPALEALREYGEVNLFLRGIIPTIGFPTASVTYARQARLAGETGYPLRKMLALAWDGITSFSSLPLRMVSVLGMLVFLASLILSGWVLWARFVTGTAIPGWTSSVLPIYFLGGVQLFCIGLVGEYVAKIYLETKRRPRFIIEKRL
jgi:glycosyltransferase involved in cell wall biosynthesis